MFSVILPRSPGVDGRVGYMHWFRSPLIRLRCPESSYSQVKCLQERGDSHLRNLSGSSFGKERNDRLSSRCPEAQRHWAYCAFLRATLPCEHVLGRRKRPYNRGGEAEKKKTLEFITNATAPCASRASGFLPFWARRIEQATLSNYAAQNTMYLFYLSI